MRKLLSVIMITIMLTGVWATQGLAVETAIDFPLDSTNFTIDSNSAWGQFEAGGVLNVNNAGTAQSNAVRVISNQNLEQDLDIQFETLLTKPSGSWELMVFVRDQDPGKASWERGGLKSGYNISFWNDHFEVGYADLGTIPGGRSGVYNIADGEAHKVRISCKNDSVSGNVIIKVYFDNLTAPILTVTDSSTDKITSAGKLTFVGATNGAGQLDGTIHSFKKIMDVAATPTTAPTAAPTATPTAVVTVAPTDVPTATPTPSAPTLTSSMGTVDLFSGTNTNFLSFNNGAVLLTNPTMAHLKAIVPTQTTPKGNGRVFIDSGIVESKDATYNFTMKINNYPAIQNGWMGQIMLRDQDPGQASWDRDTTAEDQSTTAAYMVFLWSNKVEVVYLTSWNTNGVATGLEGGNTWSIPGTFDWSLAHDWSCGVAEIGGKTTITVMIDGETVIKTVDSRAKITKAGGFTIVGKTDINGTDATTDITALSVDLTDKSTESTDESESSESESTASESTVSEEELPVDVGTGDNGVMIYVVIISLFAGAFIVYKKRKACK